MAAATTTALPHAVPSDIPMDLQQRLQRSVEAATATTTTSSRECLLGEGGGTLAAGTLGKDSDDWLAVGTLINAQLQQQLRAMEESQPDREFVCAYPDCHTAFVNKGHLDRHMRMHTKEKPYACPLPICGKRFSRRTSYRERESAFPDPSSPLVPLPPYFPFLPLAPPPSFSRCRGQHEAALQVTRQERSELHTESDPAIVLRRVVLRCGLSIGRLID